LKGCPFFREQTSTVHTASARYPAYQIIFQVHGEVNCSALLSNFYNPVGNGGDKFLIVVRQNKITSLNAISPSLSAVIDSRSRWLSAHQGSAHWLRSASCATTYSEPFRRRRGAGFFSRPLRQRKAFCLRSRGQRFHPLWEVNTDPANQSESSPVQRTHYSPEGNRRW